VGVLFIILLIFFALRALTYFARGRLAAGVFASLACLLFLGGLYADHAGQNKAKTQAARRSA
jgi:hypothetical protein